jgi:hypothetical protein
MTRHRSTTGAATQALLALGFTLSVTWPGPGAALADPGVSLAAEALLLRGVGELHLLAPLEPPLHLGAPQELQLDHVVPLTLRLDLGPLEPATLEAQQVARPGPRSPALTAAAESLTVFLVWANYNRLSGTKEWANVTPQSIWTNLSSRWVLDDNEYYVNQMGHPYQGSLSFGAARSAGLGFWASTAYPFAFSALWELAGETERPSINDQITTTVGGIVLGEILYRASDWVRGDGRSFWRQAVATLLSPVSTVNRTVVVGGDPEPPAPLRLSAGLGAITTTAFEPGAGGVAPSLDLRLALGVPGSPGWRFERPFDHFDLALLYASTPDPVFNLRARGLMVGSEFAESPTGGGLWGLWLSFDLVGPSTRRVSTSALGLGGTGRWALGPALTLEGTAVASAVLLGATGVTAPVGERSYRFGPGAQGVLETYLSVGDRFRAGLELRPYVVTAAGAPGGRDVLLEGEALARLRLWGHNALEVSTTRTRRWSTEASGLDTRDGVTQVMVSWRWAVEPLGAGVVRG